MHSPVINARRRTHLFTCLLIFYFLVWDLQDLQRVVRDCSQVLQLKKQIAEDNAIAGRCAVTEDQRNIASVHFQHQLMVQRTMRLGSTAKVIAKRVLKYRRPSGCSAVLWASSENCILGCCSSGMVPRAVFRIRLTSLLFSFCSLA